MLQAEFDLEQLHMKCMGNIELMESLINRFRTKLPSTKSELTQAAQNGDLETIHLLAHRLKGESGTMCCRPLSESADCVSQATRTRDLQAIVDLIAELTGEIDAILRLDLDDQLQSQFKKNSAH